MNIRFTKDYTDKKGRTFKKDQVYDVISFVAAEIIAKGYAKPHTTGLEIKIKQDKTGRLHFDKAPDTKKEENKLDNKKAK